MAETIAPGEKPGSEKLLDAVAEWMTSKPPYYKRDEKGFFINPKDGAPLSSYEQAVKEGSLQPGVKEQVLVVNEWIARAKAALNDKEKGAKVPHTALDKETLRPVESTLELKETLTFERAKERLVSETRKLENASVGRKHDMWHAVVEAFEKMQKGKGIGAPAEEKPKANPKMEKPAGEQKKVKPKKEPVPRKEETGPTPSQIIQANRSYLFTVSQFFKNSTAPNRNDNKRYAERKDDLLRSLSELATLVPDTSKMTRQEKAALRIDEKEVVEKWDKVNNAKTDFLDTVDRRTDTRWNRHQIQWQRITDKIKDAATGKAAEKEGFEGFKGAGLSEKFEGLIAQHNAREYSPGAISTRFSVVGYEAPVKSDEEGPSNTPNGKGIGKSGHHVA